MRRMFHRVSPTVAERTLLWGKRYCSSIRDIRLNHTELQRLVKVLEDDPKLLVDLVGKLDAQSRRRVIVAGGAMEWFGKESAASEVERADFDKDLRISPKDFDRWFESALRRRLDEGRAHRQKPSVMVAEEEGEEEKAVPFTTLVRIAFLAGLPFVGFGFLDNAVMILAGDVIDSTVGVFLNCSVMACAAMGNIFSGALGMQAHGVIDKTVQKLSFKPPVLTEKQMKGQRVFLAGHIGGTAGIMTGLFLGMLPLLFLGGEEDRSDQALFHRFDQDSNGYVDLKELEAELVGLGFSTDAVKNVVEKYGQDGCLDFKQFQKIRSYIRKGEAVL